MFTGLFEQCDDSLNFVRRIFVSVFRAVGVINNRVDENRDGLLRAVENQNLVGDEEIHHGRFQFVLRRTRNGRFHVVNKFVADKTNRATGETRQSRRGHRAKFFHHAFDHFKSVFHVAPDHKTFRHATVLKHLDVRAVLPDDRARIAADERVASDVFATFDGFKKKRFALTANFAVSREWRFEVGENAACDGN